MLLQDLLYLGSKLLIYLKVIFKLLMYLEALLTDTYYIPSLSSMEITITNIEVIENILELLTQKKIIPPKILTLIHQALSNEQISQEYLTNYQYLEYIPYEQISCLKIVIRNLRSITVEYYENKPPHLRELFKNQIHLIINKYILPLTNCTINQLTGNSWFSILWTPTKSSSSNFMMTSFITYYQFKFSEESLSKQSLYGEIPIIGILPIKFLHKYYLERISKNYIGIIYDTMILKSSLENVNNIVLKNANRTSIDVEYYLKNSVTQTQIINGII